MTGFHYGGFGRRVIAFLLDNIILHAAAVTVTFIGLLIVGYEIGDAAAGLGSMVAAYYLTSVAMNMFYFTWFHGTTGQTPGKRLLGLKVVQTSGEPMNLRVAFLRWVGYLVSGLVLYLGFIWIAFDGRKQGWHDKIAGTYVIKVSPRCDEQQPDLFSKMP